MPDKPSSGSTGKLRRQLKGKAKEAQLPIGMPKYYQSLSAVDLYQQFTKYQFNRIGAMTCGYGYTGFGFGAKVGLNIGQFFLPGLVNLKGEVSGTGDVTKTLVAILHKNVSPPISMAPVPRTVRSQEPPLPESPFPLCFMALLGSTKSIEVKSTASIGVGHTFENPTGNEHADKAIINICALSEIPLSIGVSADFSLGYKYDRLHAIEPAPGWYPGPNDENLKTDFLNTILPGLTQTKKEIQDWISVFNRKVYPLTRASFEKAQQNPDLAGAEVAAAFKAAIQKEPSRLRSAITKVAEKTRKHLPSITKIYESLSTSLKELEAETHTTEALLTIVKNLDSIIPDQKIINEKFGDDPSNKERQLTIETMGRMKGQLDMFAWRLIEIKIQEAARGSVPKGQQPLKEGARFAGPQRDFHKHLCFLKIGSHTATGEALGSAKGIVAGIEGGVEGKYKRSAYRYQTFSPSERSTYVYTQDTLITYREAKLSAKAADVKDIFEKKIEKDFIVRGMTYRSRCAYWKYLPTERKVTPLPGSGLSYGVSVRKQDLIKCQEDALTFKIKQKTPLSQSEIESKKSKSLLYTLAKKLRISVTYLVLFLQQFEANGIRDQVTVPAVLLESSFYLPLDHDKKLQLTPVTEGNDTILRAQSLYEEIPANPFNELAKNLKEMRNAYQNCHSHLQSIRLRTRMADFAESEVTFKLGIPPVGVTGGIQLRRIENAGQESVPVSKHVPFKTPDEALEVPPVAIFHQ